MSYTNGSGGKQTIRMEVWKSSGGDPEWVNLAVTGAGVEEREYTTPDHSITIPGDALNVEMITVGASSWMAPGQIQPYSSAGPTTDGRLKPDVAGPDKNRTTRSIWGDPDLPDLATFGGTSAAAPHVAGLAAQLREAYPGVDAATIAGWIRDIHRFPVTPSPNVSFGHGIAQLDVSDVYPSSTKIAATIGSDGTGVSIIRDFPPFVGGGLAIARAVDQQTGADFTSPSTSVGEFTIDGLSPNTEYTVVAQIPGFLTSTTVTTTLAENQVRLLPSVALFAGDVNGDGIVNILDISMMTAADKKKTGDRTDYRFSPARYIDLNADGIINVLDYSAASANFLMSGPTPWN